MMPRHIIYIALLVLLTACSTIADDERLIEVPPVEVARHVLIEDYTGQRCVNCPAATEVIASLQSTYGEENVIAVGIYSGPFGKTTSGRNYSLTTDTGNYYYDAANIDAQPSACINRHSPNSVTATWAAEVYNALQEATTLELSLASSYDSLSRGGTLTLTATATAPISGALSVWLMESGITDFQYLEDGSIDEAYTHNHVFRTTLSTVDGDPYTLANGATESVVYPFSLADDWQEENMSAVAFVADGEGVVQVVAAPLLPSNSANP